MSTNSGIFDSLPNPSQSRQDSPFSVASDQGGTPAPASPFTAAAHQDSPFSVVDQGADSKAGSGEKPVKLPERRKPDSSFQMAEPSEEFGFEAPAKSPFGASAQNAPAASFAMPEPQAAGFTDWKESAPAASPAASAQVPSAFASPSPASGAPAQAAPASQPAAAAQPQIADSESDSYNIRQLELRAIFGVDREMNADEILQRARALPGIRNLAKLTSQDMATLEAVKKMLPTLGFGNGTLKLYAGAVPLEFIREGSVMLAVQTDGGFAPGVRETIMIVARELGRLG